MESKSMMTTLLVMVVFAAYFKEISRGRFLQIWSFRSVPCSITIFLAHKASPLFLKQGDEGSGIRTAWALGHFKTLYSDSFQIRLTNIFRGGGWQKTRLFPGFFRNPSLIVIHDFLCFWEFRFSLNRQLSLRWN